MTPHPPAIWALISPPSDGDRAQFGAGAGGSAR